jgi:hypothetical protein
MLKKGAMFGLDARIALAIFGALSVISGASLYSAIQDSKVTAYVTEFSEITKAYEQFYLDTGQQLPQLNSTYLDVEALITNNNNISGWNGPYLPYNFIPTNALESNNLPNVFAIVLYSNDDFGELVLPTSCKVNDCHAYLHLQTYPIEIADAIDKKIDGVSDRSKGKVRLYYKSSSIQPNERNIYIKIFDRDL